MPADTTHDHPPPTAENEFAGLGLRDTLVAALDRRGFRSPTELQRRMIPALIDGKDCLVQARTGTGKTAAYGLPILHRLVPERGLQAIILVPARGLARQVERILHRFIDDRDVPTAVVAGRRDDHSHAQLDGSQKILIGTPGPIKDMIRRRKPDLAGVGIVVIDELDVLLDGGAGDNIRNILDALRHEHQTILIATDIDQGVRSFAAALLRDPLELDAAPPPSPVEVIVQHSLRVDRRHKFGALLSFLEHESPRLAILFTNSARDARQLNGQLQREGIDSRTADGRRLRRRQRRGEAEQGKQLCAAVVAHDPAARRLAVLQLSHLVNYDIPADPDAYVQRFEACARLSRRGYALTFVAPDETELLAAIERRVEKRLSPPQADWATQPFAERKPQAAPPRPATERDGQPDRQNDEPRADQPPPVARTLGSRLPSHRKTRRIRWPR